MTCDRIRRLMPLAVGGDLRPVSREALDAHLRTCGSCADEFESHRRSHAALRGLDPAPPIPGGWEGLQAAVFAKAGLETPGRVLPGPGSAGRWRILRIAAALVAGIGLGFIGFQWARQGTTPPGPTGLPPTVVHVGGDLAPAAAPPAIARRYSLSNFGTEGRRGVAGSIQTISLPGTEHRAYPIEGITPVSDRQVAMGF